MPAPEPDTPAGREVPATGNTANAAARPAITGPEASAPMSTPAPDIMNAAEPGNIAPDANVPPTAPSAAPTVSATTSQINVITLPTVKAFTVTATAPVPAAPLPQAEVPVEEARVEARVEILAEARAVLDQAAEILAEGHPPHILIMHSVDATIFVLKMRAILPLIPEDAKLPEALFIFLCAYQTGEAMAPILDMNAVIKNSSKKAPGWEPFAFVFMTYFLY